MILHCLKIAFRNLVKYRQQTIVSVVGLAVGFVCFALSAYWIRYEMSFDSFHANADRIYQLRQLDKTKPSGFDLFIPPIVTPMLENQFPAIKASCANNLNMNLEPGKNRVSEKALRVDERFFDIFDIEIIHGEGLDMDNELGVLISEEFAWRYFKTDNAVGKMLPYYIMDQEIPYKLYTVKGVVKSWPKNSNLRFEIIMPIEKDYIAKWEQSGCVYIQLDKQTDPETLKGQLEQLHLKNAVGEDLCYTMIPITEAYYTEPVYNAAGLKFDQVLLFAVLGLMVVICALFNYLNLYASRIRMRGKELSLRKVNGASNRSIFVLLLSEFLLLLLLALLLGFVGIEWVMPQFQKFADIQSDSISIYMELLLYVGGIMLISILMAWGVVVYTRHKLFQESIRTSGRNQNLFSRAALITQMIISLGFIFCTSVYFKQIYTLSHHNMSIAKDNIITLSLEKGFSFAMDSKEVDLLLDGLKGESSIAQTMPIGDGTILPRMMYTLMQAKISETTTDQEAVPYNSLPVPPEFIDFYGLELIAGRNFNAETDRYLGAWAPIQDGVVIVNQTAVRKLGLGDNPLGKQFFIQKRPYEFRGQVYAEPLRRQTVIGVVRDFVFESPLTPVEPVIMTCEAIRNITVALKSNPGQYDDMIAAVNRVVEKTFPDNKPRIHNMAKVYQQLFETEASLRFLLALLSLICVVISLFGIYAMVSLNSERRRKEIAVRKVNGAPLLSLFLLFAREYLYLLLLAAVIAFPVGYYIMRQWCEKFVIQTPMSSWVFLSVLALTAFLIFVTVVWRVWKTAHINPAQELKKE